MAVVSYSRLRGTMGVTYTHRQRGGFFFIVMQRLVARFLLTFVLVGVLVPAGLAATAPNPHACCKRRAMADAPAGGVQAARMQAARTQIGALPGCCNHDCCRSVTTTQWADVSRPVARQYALVLSPALPELQGGSPATAIDRIHFGRAPPLRFSN
jgi:hypothetical protein